MEELNSLIEEFDILMQAGFDELAVDDMEIAEEYFSDAAHVLEQIYEHDQELYEKLANKYSVNPLDFAT